MSRWKTVIGPKLKARSFPNQRTEDRIGAYILNKMTELGRPVFELVASPEVPVRARSTQQMTRATTPREHTLTILMI